MYLPEIFALECERSAARWDARADREAKKGRHDRASAYRVNAEAKRLKAAKFRSETDNK